jgi:outer membrane protein
MNKRNWLNGLMALGAIGLFSQCNSNSEVANSNANAGVVGTATMKIAYVDVDTLLAKYNLSTDLNEQMMRKQENATATLNEKGKAFEAEAKEFQRKLENNAFTRERAEQEQARLLKKQQDLQALQGRLESEIQQEAQKNSLQLRDSINAFLTDYNKDHKYSLIISNTGFDNLLYADPSYNITEEIVAGLNKRYKPSDK